MVYSIVLNDLSTHYENFTRRFVMFIRAPQPCCAFGTFALARAALHAARPPAGVLLKAINTCSAALWYLPIVSIQQKASCHEQMVEKKPRAARLIVWYDWFSPAGLITLPLCALYKNRGDSFWHSYIVMHTVVHRGPLGEK